MYTSAPSTSSQLEISEEGNLGKYLIFFLLSGAGIGGCSGVCATCAGSGELSGVLTPELGSQLLTPGDKYWAEPRAGPAAPSF